MRVLVTGGAGFLGSHLCETLLKRGDSVVCVDDLSTGRRDNLSKFADDPKFTFVQLDVSTALNVPGRLDAVTHLASPASPPDYHRLPLETLAVGSRSIENALKLAERKAARFVLASTSEISGDPTVHPQNEQYWGNVSSIGPRSVYDEAKRFAEAISMAYSRSRGVNVGIVRIFNTFGPRMRAEDGRVVSSFIAQALNGDPLTIYGDGQQTRSFCYVDDLIRGLVAMIDSNETGPINLETRLSGQFRNWPNWSWRSPVRPRTLNSTGGPWMTQPAAARTSASPQMCWAGNPRSPPRRAWRRPSGISAPTQEKCRPPPRNSPAPNSKECPRLRTRQRVRPWPSPPRHPDNTPPCGPSGRTEFPRRSACVSL